MYTQSPGACMPARPRMSALLSQLSGPQMIPENPISRSFLIIPAAREASAGITIARGAWVSRSRIADS